MKKAPTAALLIVPATLAALAVPAGAAPSKDWTVKQFACRVGHKSAVVGWSPTHPHWLGADSIGNGIPNPHAWAAWYKNPCPGQWLDFRSWTGYASEGSTIFWDAATGTAGKAPDVSDAQLADAPICDVGGNGLNIVVPKGPPQGSC